jgi:uncharacterized protein CbrC (UPF0167 family)
VNAATDAKRHAEHIEKTSERHHANGGRRGSIVKCKQASQYQYQSNAICKAKNQQIVTCVCVWCVCDKNDANKLSLSHETPFPTSNGSYLSFNFT